MQISNRSLYLEELSKNTYDSVGGIPTGIGRAPCIKTGWRLVLQISSGLKCSSQIDTILST